MSSFLILVSRARVLADVQTLGSRNEAKLIFTGACIVAIVAELSSEARDARELCLRV